MPATSLSGRAFQVSNRSSQVAKFHGAAIQTSWSLKKHLHTRVSAFQNVARLFRPQSRQPAKHDMLKHTYVSYRPTPQTSDCLCVMTGRSCCGVWALPSCQSYAAWMRLAPRSAGCRSESRIAAFGTVDALSRPYAMGTSTSHKAGSSIYNLLATTRCCARYHTSSSISTQDTSLLRLSNHYASFYHRRDFPR